MHDRLRAAILIGEDAQQMQGAFAGRADTRLAGSLDDAVKLAAEIAMPGDAVLLAPACASFDQFPNYMQRGIAFCKAVEGLPS